MNGEHIISILTVVATLSVKLIGFPLQILKIHKAGSLEGVSVLYFVLAFITYLLWTTHGIIKKDPIIIMGQGIGVLASGVLLIVLVKTARRIREKKMGLPESSGNEMD